MLSDRADPVRPDATPAAGTTAPQRVQLFFNPRAGSARREHVAALVAAFEATGATVTVTPSLSTPPVLADGVDHVCIAGGDGTVRHVAAAVARADRPPSLSVYPLGTVNLLARECGYALGPAAFVRRVVNCDAPRRHHAALVGDVPMLVCASVGPDSEAVDRLSPMLKRMIGRAAYGVAFAQGFVRWRRPRLRVIAGDRDIACAAVYVAKGRFYAGRWSLAPAAVDEPLLHVVAFERLGRLAFLRAAWAIVRGREPRGAIRFTCTALDIFGDGATAVQADGDIVARLPVQIAPAPGTLAFV